LQHKLQGLFCLYNFVIHVQSLLCLAKHA
jgi:hypothetical protein